MNKVEGIENKVAMLRYWCSSNQRHVHAVDVVSFGLDLVIKATTYSPNARVYRELAMPLPWIENSEAARELVKRFSSQKGTTLRLGPTVEHVRLEMLLARSEWRCDRAASKNRLSDTYLLVTDIDDVAIRSACLGHLFATVALLDPKREIETELKLESSLRSDLQGCIGMLLAKTARQFQASKELLRCLAKADLDWAASTASELNTVDRRDKGFAEIISSRCRHDVASLDLQPLLVIVDKIFSPEIRDAALLNLIHTLAQVPSPLPVLEPFVDDVVRKTDAISDAPLRCRAYCLLHSILLPNSALADALEVKLQNALEVIDVGWNKIRTGYNVVSFVADYSRDRALKYLEWTERVRAELGMDDPVTANTYILTVELVIRAYSGLLPRRLESAKELESVTALINAIPSSGIRAQFFADLVVSYCLAGRSDDVTRFAADRIKPLLLQISDYDKTFKAHVIKSCATALYYTHRETAMDYLNMLTSGEKDSAVVMICRTILRRTSCMDPFEAGQGHEYLVSYEDIRDILTLLDLVGQDSGIYFFIEGIVDTLYLARKTHRFSEQQISDIKFRLRDLAAKKFPNADYIKHEGYRVLCDAQIARLENQKWPVWEALVNRATLLPNVSDMVFVLSRFAPQMPTKLFDERRRVLEKAKDLIQEIPAGIDRIEHLEMLAEMSSLADKAFSKECISRGIDESLSNSEDDVDKVLRRLVDLAERVDPDYAASFASVADSDPAKDKSEIVRSQLKRIDVRKSILNQDSSTVDSTSFFRYLSAATALHGQLNAGRVAPVGIEGLRAGVLMASSHPLRQSSAIFDWIIANVIKKYANGTHASKYIPPLFDAMMSNANLAGRIAGNLISGGRQIPRVPVAAEERNLIVKPGDRGKALRFISKWFEGNVRDYLKICDPYFGRGDLPLVSVIRSIDKSIPIEILTGKQYIDQERGQQSIEDYFRDWWRIRVSYEDAGDVTIVVVGTKKAGKCPIHDRWWLTNGAGLRVGTSFASLGVSKLSEISVLDAEIAVGLQSDVDQYLLRRVHDTNGKRLSYCIFTLD